MVLGAAALTALLFHAYGSPAASGSEKLPALVSIQPQPTNAGLVDVLIKAITGLLQNIIESVASPFMRALNYFTTSTPLMATNGEVFKLWLAIVGITDALFVVVVALLGFHIMSYASLGLDEIEFKHVLPQLGLAFLALNSSIFIIDGIISLSNAMIHALQTGLVSSSVWSTLSSITQQAPSLSIAALLVMMIFLILSVVLLVYYVVRLVVLYIGAVLSPLIVLLWLLPSFRDFAKTAVKLYSVTIFVLFIHVAILQLAASIFAGLVLQAPNHLPDPIMALLVGLATVVVLLKTQNVLMQLSYVSLGPKTARALSHQFVNSVSLLSNTRVSRSLGAETLQAAPSKTFVGTAPLLHSAATSSPAKAVRKHAFRSTERPTIGPLRRAVNNVAAKGAKA